MWPLVVLETLCGEVALLTGVGTDVMKDTVDTWDELVAKVEGQNKPLPAARSKSCIIL